MYINKINKKEMDKQKVIEVLLLITIVFSVASIILTVGIDVPKFQLREKVITYYPAGEGSANLIVLPPKTGGTSP